MSFEQGSGGSAGSWWKPSSASPSAPSTPYAGAGGSAPAPAGGTTPSMPDWASIISSSPYVLAANALAQQQLAALKAQMGSSASRALINLGDASLANQVGNLDIPNETAGLVDKANTAGTSVLSQLGYHHDQNVEAIPAGLAGRGFYRSGQTGYSLGQEDKQYGQQQYSARQSTLDYLNGLYQNYLSSQFGIQQQQLAAEMSAYQSALANIGSYITPGGGGGVSGAPAPGGLNISDWLHQQGSAFGAGMGIGGGFGAGG